MKVKAPRMSLRRQIQGPLQMPPPDLARLSFPMPPPLLSEAGETSSTMLPGS